MKYTLHKLPEGFIITSDEEIKEGIDYCFDTKSLEIFKSKTWEKHASENYLKVIAQQEEIDFSALSEEEQKEIRFFDWKKYCDLDNGKYGTNSHSYFLGFRKAQELLSDRIFTLEELVKDFKPAFDKFINNGGAIGSSENWIQWQNVVEWFPKFLQSLSQKSWDIEIEMEYPKLCCILKEGKRLSNKGCMEKNHCEQPKFTNNKIKITKIL
jgi:hypothetical protein